MWGEQVVAPILWIGPYLGDVSGAWWWVPFDSLRTFFLGLAIAVNGEDGVWIAFLAHFLPFLIAVVIVPFANRHANINMIVQEAGKVTLLLATVTAMTSDLPAGPGYIIAFVVLGGGQLVKTCVEMGT